MRKRALIALLLALALSVCPLAGAAPFRPACGVEAYESLIMEYIVKYGGACCPLDDASITSGPLAGVARELTGVYPGAISGVTYYNQVTVTGTLSPDATGTYAAAGVYNGYPYYQRGSDAYYLWYMANYSGGNYWIINTILGSYIGNRWYYGVNVPGIPVINHTYTPYPGTTGTATVANVTASGIYLFVPSGVTLQSTGPIVSGETAKAAALTTSGSVSLGASFLDPSGAFSMAAWVNCTNPSGATEQVVFGCALSATKRFTVSVKSDVLQSGYNNGTTTYAASGTLTTGWHHIAASHASGNNAPVLYIDGTAQAGTTAPTFASTNNTRFGARNDNTLFFAGSLADCMKLNAAITATDALSLYNAAVKGL